MKDKQAGEKWEKPELVALVRNRPEESILTVCKLHSGSPITGPLQNPATCDTTSCRACDSHTS
jgi:hypothetical protein